MAGYGDQSWPQVDAERLRKEQRQQYSARYPAAEYCRSRARVYQPRRTLRLRAAHQDTFPSYSSRKIDSDHSLQEVSAYLRGSTEEGRALCPSNCNVQGRASRTGLPG